MVIATIALSCAVLLAGFGIRGWLPVLLLRLKKPLSAAALLVSALVVVLTNGAPPGLVAVGLAAWGMAEVFGASLGIAAFALAGAAAALSLVRVGPPSRP